MKEYFVVSSNMIRIILLIGLLSNNIVNAQTIAFWPFDEQQGIYPSCVLSDLSDNDFPMVLGLGGKIVKGKFGNALHPEQQSKFDFLEIEDEVSFGLTKLLKQEGKTQEPMNWFNANFSALMTSGEKHLRKQVGFAQATKTKLNLGYFDWTIEFWYKPLDNLIENGTVFEIGTGPRGENEIVTFLKLNKEQNQFIIYNQPNGNTLYLPTNLKHQNWQHVVFMYNATKLELTHYVNGNLISKSENIRIEKLPQGDEDYFSVGRNGIWEEPLSGIIDELRFSEGNIYSENFSVPESFSYINKSANQNNLLKGPQLLFNENSNGTINLGNRKHLFIDDYLLELSENVDFVVNPPQKKEIVLTDIAGPFRKHLSVLEDEKGNIRIYTTVDDDYLAVWISKDGINFSAPDLQNGKYKNNNNIVLHENVGMGVVFIDPNAPKEERWKYISDYHRRAVSLFYSEDGLNFKRYKQPVLPFRSGSQANIYYDDQKQVYTAFHRSDFGRTKSGATQRDFVMTETRDLLKPWPFKALTDKEYKERVVGKRVAKLIPWYLDNGPLTPGGFSLEYPWIFSPIDSIDPSETDIYVPKAQKYAWAPDTYLAFPILYFHYEDSEPITRKILMDPKRKRGSGPLETQLAISRNGVDWQRHPRPAYVGIGEHDGIDFKTSYIAYGMIKRDNEIWQYCFSEPHYHSPWEVFPNKRAVYRLVQRLDGFISIDSPYEKEIYITTKPLIFEGKRLLLNVDTDAAGYLQVGFLDENGNDIEGFSVDDCIYINGDFIETEVEWMKNKDDIERISNNNEEIGVTLSEKVVTSKDVSKLAGKTVRIIFRMRGSKLYSLKFD